MCFPFSYWNGEGSHVPFSCRAMLSFLVFMNDGVALSSIILCEMKSCLPSSSCETRGVLSFLVLGLQSPRYMNDGVVLSFFILCGLKSCLPSSYSMRGSRACLPSLPLSNSHFPSSSSKTKSHLPSLSYVCTFPSHYLEDRVALAFLILREMKLCLPSFSYWDLELCLPTGTSPSEGANRMAAVPRGTADSQ